MADIVEAATHFLDTFYKIFDTGSRSTLLSYYSPTARMIYDDAIFIGPQEIVTFLVEAPKRIENKRAKTAIEPLDDGPVMVLVTGILEFGGGNAATKFATTFLLGKGEGGLVIERQVSSISFEGTEELDLDDD